MLGTNKNQTIHEVLTKLDHLDNHKPYGGLSIIFTGDLKQLGNTKIWREMLNELYTLAPVKDAFIFKPATVHGRPRAAGKLWDHFENFHLTQKVRSAGDKKFSELCDRIGFNTITEEDIHFLKSRDLPCPLEWDPENFRDGKVSLI